MAAYGANRQLLDSWVYELKAGANSVTQSLTNIDAETVQIFVLGTGAIPVCESSPVPAG